MILSFTINYRVTVIASYSYRFQCFYSFIYK